MTRVRNRLGTWMAAVVILAAVLAAVRGWVLAGGPVGFVCGSCQSSVGGRDVVVSSDHLLTPLTLNCDATQAVLDVEGRRVVVRGDLATVDGMTTFAIPAGSRKVEFDVSGGSLRVRADGRTVPAVGR